MLFIQFGKVLLYCMKCICKRLVCAVPYSRFVSPILVHYVDVHVSSYFALLSSSLCSYTHPICFIVLPENTRAARSL